MKQKFSMIWPFNISVNKMTASLTFQEKHIKVCCWYWKLLNFHKTNAWNPILWHDVADRVWSHSHFAIIVTLWFPCPCGKWLLIKTTMTHKIMMRRHLKIRCKLNSHRTDKMQPWGPSIFSTSQLLLAPPTSRNHLNSITRQVKLWKNTYLNLKTHLLISTSIPHDFTGGSSVFFFLSVCFVFCCFCCSCFKYQSSRMKSVLS